MSFKYLLGCSLAVVLIVVSGTAAWAQEKPAGDKRIVLKTDGELTDQDRKTQGAFYKVHAVRLEAETLYKIDLLGARGLDTYLRVQDGVGQVLGEDDDSGDNLNARVLFRPKQTETYEVIATTFKKGATGKYTLIVALATALDESQLFAKQDKIPQAIAAGEKALATQRTELGAEHEGVVKTLQHLAKLRERVEDFAAAQKDRREVLRLQTKQFGAKAWQVTDARLDLQDLESLTKLDAKVRKELRDADQWMEKAAVNGEAGKYQEGAKNAEKALAIRKKVLGDDHPATASSLNSLGILLARQGEHGAARTYYDQALAIRKKVLGDDHPDSALSLNNLGNLLFYQVEYAAARPYYDQALAIRKKVLRDNHPDTAKSLMNLGNLLAVQEDFAAARPYYDQALAIFKKELGDDHPDIANLLNNLGAFLVNQGDYAAARPYYDQALAIRKKELGDNHPDTAWSLMHLGALLARQGDHAAARPYCEQALAIFKKVLGHSHPHTATVLSNLGELQLKQGNYAAAHLSFEQALAIRKKVLGDSHPDTAWSLSSLGELLCEQGDYAAARPYCEQALAIFQKVLGDNHSDTASALHTLGDLMTNTRDRPGARANYEKALIISRRNLKVSAAGQSERQQLLMASKVRHHLDSFLSAAAADDADVAALYAHVMDWKGSILIRQQRMRQVRSDPKLAPLCAELRAVSAQLATLSFSSPDPTMQATWTKKLAQLSEQQEDLERQLAGRSAAFRAEQAQQNLTPQELLKALPADAALVDFLVYRHAQADPKNKGKWLSEQRLTAFVLRRGAAIVRLDLGPMEPIEKAIDLWRLMIQAQPGKKHPGTELRRLLWVPLEKNLAGARTVLISPDGALNYLPFAALPGSKQGSYLLEEVAVAVLPVPRLLPQPRGKAKADEQLREPTLLLVGDIDYNATAGKASDQSRTAPTGQQTIWKHLPATKGEILEIRDSFEKRFPDGKIKVLRGGQASDAALSDLATKYSHMHVATHAFFAPPSVRSALAKDGKGRSGGMSAREGVTGFHPGLLSGLVLAGANQPPAPGQDDGILTALEVAELDLSRSELVVLSACGTGLGKSVAGEGILGLQRAFQVAGARTVVASLWEVDDAATRDLMDRFYDNHFAKKLDRLESLREAQLWMLNNDKKYRSTRLILKDAQPNLRTPPEFWAAFVLSGDWK